MSSSTPGSEGALTKVATPSPSPLAKMEADFTSSKFEMHPSLSDEERRFYIKMYPNVDLVNQRRVHCTVCKLHLGTAPAAESNIKMHPILRVTHCVKCHDFYNSGEFSKGEDGSELYCRWCGQGGEVYCCSTCPYVFCKSCIVKNLSKGVIVDIEQNEHWNCFSCTSKILWPLRAQHWALVNYLQTQKRALQTLQLPEVEARRQMLKDNSNCCRLAKSKTSSLSDSMESLESNVSKRSQGSSGSSKRGSLPKTIPSGPPAKRSKASNDEVVCTPDLLSMLEPDCQLSVTPKATGRQSVPAASITTTPRIVTVQQNYQPGPSSSNSSSNGSTSGSSSVPPPRSSLPPPLVLSGSGIRYRQNAPGGVSGVVRRTVVPNSVKTTGPVFHTINGFKVDLNSAAQQDSYRLPNGRLIQVKRQLPQATQPAPAPPPTPPTPPALVVPQVGPGVVIRPRAPVTSNRPSLHISTYGSNMGIYNPQTNQQQRAPHVRVGNANPAPPPLQGPPPNVNGGQTLMITPAPPPPPKVPTLVRHTFPNTPMGQARAQLQEQIFSAMDICTHLTGKVVSLTHSNAYNQVRSYLELKELYIHMSYLMTYAIGRFKNLQEKCLVDMREKGFKNDANSLENGQLAAAVDYVCYGQLDDVDLFNTGCNSFHNQVYEYRKSLHANLKEGEDCEPLPPLMPLGVRAEGDPIDEPEEPETVPEQQQDEIGKDHEEAPDFDYDEPDELDDDLDDDDLDNEECGELGTEESMNRNEQAHAYDRKLTRLLREYPSLWCTRHPDYGKKEVTNKQWRVIASHFPRGDDIKLRWKNVRKRYVRIERRLKQGKRFKGYFDKATNYLENRDRPRSEWLAVDCGEDDGDGFERKHLDVIENKMEQKALKHPVVKIKLKGGRVPMRPLEVRPIDQRIITFAKSHPVLWRKSADPEFNSIDEQTRKSLWQNFWKSAPNYACEYLVERWQQMYEMYKSFRLKSIKDKGIFANLELKYSKYLASLYFLYKIDEQDLRDEFEPLQDCVPTATESAGNLKDMPDDKQFCQQLVLAMRAYPTLWNPRHVDYSDVGARERLWPEVARRLPRFKRDAQACKLRWQMAKFAYECYLREMERHPRVNERKLQKLRSNFPLEEMRFLNI
ncbi:uncharacterized protein LOC6547031 isoform X2 [Drosophila erecta]|uniref:Uncharacterized protein, isoform B n=1 Tax=Drosophila erecta TaxID=7220 RepID=A0A0Q5W142_DROER|nr:uncharacterized protein LOC6547031 isoform X2 [Drosophila erecta]XP_026836055.1 uncharacterized protein LOC6547031 isoform X2 [Drosophila erecta]KQS62866.1 uncharacterized protein Dere_GG20232, isoform B [Drosophila erecta]